MRGKDSHGGQEVSQGDIFAADDRGKPIRVKLSGPGRQGRSRVRVAIEGNSRDWEIVSSIAADTSSSISCDVNALREEEGPVDPSARYR